MDLHQAKEAFSKHVYNLQELITDKMRELDPGLELTEDIWEREDHNGNPGGGGRTRAFRGKVFENAGVNVSKIHGALSPQFAKELGGESTELWATGISLILHPWNPKVPTVHANFRMIHKGDKFWFGGGADLTPYYPYPEDFRSFHTVWKNACSPYNCYEGMKKTCDDYFTNHHRGGEMRGVGGIFYDHYSTGDLEKDLKMSIDLSNHFIPSYFPLAETRVGEAFSEEDEDFQLHRRGRYVEFNLIHDRGTTFGLKSNGRTDSILISLPGRCKFTYRYKPQEGSAHEEMMKYYFPKEW